MGCLGRYAIPLVTLCLLLVVASSLAQTCGKRRVMNLLVVNGTEAKDGYWPWHMALYQNIDQSFEYACGGAILDRNTVLTAAHCVMTQNGEWERERLLVHVGRNRLRVESNRVQKHEVLQLIVHPNYTVSSSKHDIALIKLATDITYTDYIQPICLWNRGDDLNAIVGSWGTVVGFGRDETGNVSNTLREATVPVVSHMTCIESNRNAFAFHLTSDMFCAGSRDGISPCNGDSGGGIFFNYNDVWFIRGIVSFTKPDENTFLCDTNEHTVFTDVAKYLTWMRPYLRITGDQPVVIEPEISFNTRLLPMSTCGANPYADREESSKPVLLGYPWVGLLEFAYSASAKKTMCQATFISDRYLITAVRCVKMFTGKYTLSVHSGEYDQNTPRDCAQVDGKRVCLPPVRKLRIESVIAHPNYNEESFANDIALIRLRDLASNVKPICLPVTYELRNQASTHYIQTAFTYDRILLERTIRETVDYNECIQLIKVGGRPIDLTPQHTCMKLQNNPTCKYPLLGAPLQLVQKVQGEKRYVLYGMLSIGIRNCTYSHPEVFTSVASYMGWILENIKP